jgi:hypothetical protein
MRKVLARIEAACRASPRHVIVAYSNPQHAAVFDAAGFLAPRVRRRVLCVYAGGSARTDAPPVPPLAGVSAAAP